MFAEEIQKYLEYVQKLKYDEKPDYAKCKKFFTDAFKKNGLKDDSKLDFSKKAASTPVASVIPFFSNFSTVDGPRRKEKSRK